MEVLLNTGDIQNAASQLKSRAAEIESAIQLTDTAISPLRSFRSPRVERDLGSWDQIRSIFLRDLQNLIDSADELARAAADNEAANN